jgi:hypothetical protein
MEPEVKEIIDTSVTTTTTTTETASPSLWCFHCKKHMPVKNCKEGVTKFRSQKVGKRMTRATWIANCFKCSANIRSFKKGAKKVEVKVEMKEVGKDVHAPGSPF